VARSLFSWHQEPPFCKILYKEARNAFSVVHSNLLLLLVLLAESLLWRFAGDSDQRCSLLLCFSVLTPLQHSVDSGMQPHLLFDQWTKEFEENLSAEERNLPTEVIQAMLVAYLIKKANQRMAIDSEFKQAIEKVNLSELTSEVLFKHEIVHKAGKSISKTQANGKNGDEGNGLRANSQG